MTWFGSGKIKRKVYCSNPLQVARTQGFVHSLSCVFKFGMGVQHYMSYSLHDVMRTALREGYVNLVEFILKCGVSVEHDIFERGSKTTMLKMAAKHGQLRLVQIHIEQGADVNMCDKFDKYTALMCAAVGGHVQVAELLLQHKASVNVTNIWGDTALLLVNRHGNDKMIDLLLKHISLDTNNITVLITRAGYGDVQATQYIIQNKIINSQDKDGRTALLIAAEQGKTEILNLLLEQGADVNVCGKYYNYTPLMCAARRGHVQVAEILITHRASLNVTNARGRTALWYAQHYKHDNIVQLLLQHAAHE